MRLSPAKFNKFLDGIGQSFLWRPSQACPCVSPTSGQPKATCPVCHGKGRIWADPVACTAGIVGREQAKKYADFGAWDDGEIMLSIPSDSALYACGLYDRIATADRTEPFSINFVADVNDLPLRFFVTEITSVSWIGENGLLVTGGLPIVQNGTIDWNGNTPPAGQTYSLTGRRMPEYYIYLDIPADRPYHHGQRLPRRVGCKQFDLFGR